MKKIVKTQEETRRDELVMEVRKRKDYIEGTVRTIKRRQIAMSMLPEFTREYEHYATLLDEDKCVLVSAMRGYETAREMLGEHCRTFNLAGNTFIPAYELLELYAEKS